MFTRIVLIVAVLAALVIGSGAHAQSTVDMEAMWTEGLFAN